MRRLVTEGEQSRHRRDSPLIPSLQGRGRFRNVSVFCSFSSKKNHGSFEEPVAIIPDDLDYIYYTAEAEKVVSGIESNLPSTRKDTGELLYQAKKLAEQGLTTLPKGRKDSPKAN